MAASHMACVRSSSRMNQHRVADSSEDTTSNQMAEEASNAVIDQLSQSLSHQSVISLASTESTQVVGTRPGEQTTMTQSQTSSNMSNAIRENIPKLTINKLDRLETIADIESHVDPDLSQLNVLSKLEQRWTEISSNLDNVIKHLQECSDGITTASTQCLDSFKEVSEATCDKVDDEMRALYNLISKCDLLTTKLSMASSFRDEVKTLRKSVETLDNLYKNRPQQVANQSASIVPQRQTSLE